MTPDVILAVENLVKHFPITRGGILRRQVGAIHAVDGVSFSIRRGETLGLVGESGCGKSTTGKAILQLERPSAGHVYFEGQDLTTLPDAQLRPIRRKLQVIFQDPYASLNPRMTVGEIVAEPMALHQLHKGKELQERVAGLFERVGLNPQFTNRFPHEFSGGQRQRVGIARALSLEPSLVICDEPISSLDVSIQAQVVNLLEDLQKELNLTYLFIAHDLSMVRHISNRVAVMYLGVIVELGPRDELYEQPLHPYTRALLSSVPIPDPEAARRRKRILLSGDVPSAAQPPSGCRFRTRCPIAAPICAEAQPELRELSPGHFVACHKAG